MQDVGRGELEVGDAQLVEVGHHRGQSGHPRGPLGRVGQRSRGPGVGVDELGVQGPTAVRGLDDVDEPHQPRMVQTRQQIRLPLDVCGPVPPGPA